MKRRRRFAAAPLVLVACFLLAAARRAPGGAGLLLLCPEAGPPLRALLAGLGRSLPPGTPVEAAAGEPDARALRKALERLEQAGAGKAVVVPLYLHSDDEALEHAFYLLGLRERPARAYAGGRAPERARTRLALVPAPPLNGHPLAFQALKEAVSRRSREPAREALALVLSVPADKARAQALLLLAQSQAEALRREAGFSGAAAFALRPGSARERALGERTLRDWVRSVNPRARVRLIPYALSDDGSLRRASRALQGLFFEAEEAPLLEQPLLESWVRLQFSEAQERSGAKLFLAPRAPGDDAVPKRIIQSGPGALPYGNGRGREEKTP